MHKRLSDSSHLTADIVGEPTLSETFDVRSVWRAFRRQYKLVTACVVIATAAAVAYVYVAPNKYTAKSAILILSSSYGSIAKDRDDTGLDAARLDSQVEVLKSERVQNAVISKLNLQNDPEFTGPSPLRRLLAPVFPVNSDPATAAQRALIALDANSDIKRVDKTYVIDISFTSLSPAKAATVADAIAAAYIQEQMNAKFDTNRQALTWLEGRLEDLRQKTIKAETEVQRYRASKDLATSGGRLISDQQLSQLNEQLVQASGDRAKAESRYARIKEIIDKHQIDANIAEAQSNPLINELRSRYLERAKRKQELIAKVGPNHSQVIALNEEMNNYVNQIFGELSRLAESYYSDVEIARSREKSLYDSLQEIKTTSADDKLNSVDLSAKEREAESVKAQYQALLSRYQEQQQQQTFPVAEARVITGASVPLGPSQPRGLLILIMGVLGGGVVGAGLGLLREISDRTIRSTDELSQRFGLPLIGLIPDHRRRRRRAAPGEPTSSRSRGASRLSDAGNFPFSRLADTLRSAKVAIEGFTVAQGRVVGVVSTNSGEGKTYVAANLAHVLAQSGSRVLIIDCDLRRRQMSRQLAPKNEIGLLNLLKDSDVAPGSALVQTDNPNILFMPGPVGEPEAASADLLSSARMGRILEVARNQFDYVVVDLPPIAPLIDARAIAPHVDCFLFVVAWGKTAIDHASEALSTNATIVKQCAGMIINLVDTDRMSLYSDTTAHYWGGYY
jgi:succinoglycan biosynthesis transport protein ExoP